MIELSYFDTPADAAGERYRGLLNAFRDGFFVNVNENPMDQRSRHLLQGGLLEIADRFIEDERELLTDLLHELLITSQATAANDMGQLVEGFESTTDYLVELLDQAIDDLKTQVERDLTKTMRHWTEYSVDYALRRRRMGQEFARFQAIETAKRRYPADLQPNSVRFARNHHRYALLTFALETYVMWVDRLGADHMVLVTEGGQRGERVDFIAAEGRKTFADLRDDVFHPNATTSLIAVI